MTDLEQRPDPVVAHEAEVDEIILAVKSGSSVRILDALAAYAKVVREDERDLIAAEAAMQSSPVDLRAALAHAILLLAGRAGHPMSEVWREGSAAEIADALLADPGLRDALSAVPAEAEEGASDD